MKRLLLSIMAVFSLSNSTHAQSFDETQKFCYVAQMWVPMLMESSGVNGEDVCRVGGGTICSGVSLGEGVCRAGGGTICSGVSLGEGVCRAGGGTICSGVDLGEGICRAGGGTICSGVSFHKAVCDITGNCAGYDAVSLINSVVSLCGAAVLHFGIPKY
jgi:UDP-3-O-[3-hydroxymyristoyl] glucosamine N-acyltransferase